MENDLWNEQITNPGYSESRELSQTHILEQYKLYVEMVDRISARRNLTNVFFLTLNTTIISALGIFLQNKVEITPKWLIFIPALAILTQCAAWWWLICSYRKLNSAKFEIINQLEEKLPSTPYASEWKELGEGKDIKKYLPLTYIENIVPILFGIVYISICGLLIFN